MGCNPKSERTPNIVTVCKALGGGWAPTKHIG